MSRPACIGTLSSAGLLLPALLLLAVAGHAEPTAPRVTSYFQMRLTDPEHSDADWSLRRLKVIVDGKLGRDAGYYFQALDKNGNHSSTDGQPHLQELRAWHRRGHTRIIAGQFKPPFGWERFTGDYQLALIDRSPVTSHLVPDGNLGRSFSRDRGLQWDWQAGDIGYSLGVFDGAGANNDPHGIGPLIAARASLDRQHPGSAGASVVHAEAAISWRQARDLDFSGQLPESKSLGYQHFSGHDWRCDLAAGVRAPDWEVRGEYLRAAYRPFSPSLPAITADGYYVQGSYRLCRRLEAAARYDDFDTHHGYQLTQTTVGLNLYVHGEREKVQLNYLFRGATPGVSAPDTLVCQYQRYF